MNAVIQPEAIVLDNAEMHDVEKLWQLETRCFSTDRLSQRRMRFYIDAGHAEFIVARSGEHIYGYGLLLCRRGTLLTRLYSIAVAPDARGLGIAAKLIGELERRALLRGKPFIRLEVAVSNQVAVALYEKLGFKQFGLYTHYYQDAGDALRMQKALHLSPGFEGKSPYPWYQQTTEFTCGPAALMMGMASLTPGLAMTQHLELSLWRQATTIYMTSGHGGSHPLGMALAAQNLGFDAEVWVNQPFPVFTDGVRSEHKKQVIALVENDFVLQASTAGTVIREYQWQLEDIEQALGKQCAVLCLISTYSFDKRKAPHWVVITGIDAQCVYIHDPDPAEDEEHVEVQHIPIAREDFLRLSVYGKRKIRTAVIIGSA
ncbi:GNAT family N-acetyltransferase/peptidase C39 family protein [Salinimonas chungwhensis]|uniref:GNAT family N-acetyltransferase/peptidase C39 family protein n=1 Tax=Salinimonas chungwhensis TaxID=265425 RepID=UPI000367FA80|nr:peptidase C39 family protein [Salinimonas chungwhensis]